MVCQQLPLPLDFAADSLYIDLQNEAEKVVTNRGANYCGSCYGGLEPEGGCCQTCEAVRRRRGGRYVYDTVVLDAPPTGRVTRFLNVNNEVAGLARFGPIHTQSEAVMRVLRSGETAVHFVTVLEEMPVQETLEAV